MKEYFKGKRILITGAASGIGFDLGLVLNEWGAKIAVVDIQSLATKWSTAKDLLVFQADVTNSSQMTSIRDQILASWGAIDIVIAAAGVGGINPAHCFSQELDHKIMSINYFGTVNTLNPFIESMLKNKTGQLIGICSLAAFRGLPQGASYSASKAAQMTYLESMRLDLKGTGIFVSCIHPGFVATPMADHDEFDKPFTVPVRKSSLMILKAISKKKNQYLYPLPMALLSRLNRLLPNCIYDFLMPRLSPSKAITPKLFSGGNKQE